MEQEMITRTLSNITYDGLQNFDRHVKLEEIIALTPKLQRSPEYFSLEVAERISTDISQTGEVVRLLNNKVISIEDIHLLYDIIPEAVSPLEAHASTFMPFLKYILQQQLPSTTSHKLAAQLLQQSSQFQTIGCLLLNELNTATHVKTSNLEDISTQLTVNSTSGDLILNTPTNVLKFESSYSSVANYAIVIAQFNGTAVPVVVQLRDQNLQLLKGVSLRYLGNSAQDTPSFGIVFDNYVIPKAMILSTLHQPQQQPLAIANFSLKRDLASLQHSCKDLFRAVYLAVEYTKMRKQFKQQDKEVPILDYEVVNQRITEALSFATIQQVGVNKFAFNYSLLRDNLKDKKLPLAVIFLRGLKSRLEQKILFQVEQVRECCGGFGMMKFSGFPSIIERILMRIADNLHSNSAIIDLSLTYLGKQTLSSLNNEKALQDIQNDLFRVHYFTLAMNEAGLKKRILEIGEIGEDNVKDGMIILRSVFCVIIAKKLQVEKLFQESGSNVELCHKELLEFGYELVDLFCMMQFYQIHFFKIFRLATAAMNNLYIKFYIQKLIDNISIFGDFNVKLSYQQLLERIREKKEETETEIKSHYTSYLNALDIRRSNYGTLVGNSANPQKFYETLLLWSQTKNRRNDPITAAEIQQQMIPVFLAPKQRL